MKQKDAYLRNNLRKKLSDTGLSTHALEKQAGLKRSAVQNILYGKSKKPSAEILQAITHILGCSIDELLGESSSNKAYVLPPHSLDDHKTNDQLDTGLYAKAVTTADRLFKAKGINLNKQETLNYINEIYQYSVKSQKNEIDNNFAEWLANKLLPTY